MARGAAQWMGALINQWVDHLRGPRYDAAVVDQLPGGLLVNEMVRRAMDVCVIHRRCLRHSRAYLLRARDPIDVFTTRWRAVQTDEQKRARKAATRQKRKDKANPVGPVAALKADQARAAKEAAKEAAKTAAAELRRKQQEQRRTVRLLARAAQQAAADLDEQQVQQKGRQDRVVARAYRAQARLARSVPDQVGTSMTASGRASMVPATARAWRRPVGTNRRSSSYKQQQRLSGPSTKHSLLGNLGPVDTGAE